MATYTTSQKAPNGAVNVRAYKASNFAPTSQKPSFPQAGQSAPSNPDVTDAAVNPPNYVTVTLPTQEAYIVCFVDGSSKVVSTVTVQYHPQRPVQGLMVGSGQGAPSGTVGTPVEPMLYVQTDGADGKILKLVPKP